MSKIQKLPENVINRIAAGEVLERPASAVKELMENALDAGAKKVIVKVEEGGLKLLEVSDDGAGMGKEDLPLALERHATSKIRVFEELQTIESMGFRGEALASCAAVSKLTIQTRQEGERHGWEIVCENGKLGVAQPCAKASVGTRMLVEDMFFALPARRKFMKSAQTETVRCKEAFWRVALSRPDCAFEFWVEGKKKEARAPESKEERSKAALGESFGKGAKKVFWTDGVRSVEGWCSPEKAQGSKGDEQYLFINGRFSKDRLMNGAVRAALENARRSERGLRLALWLSWPRQEVDFNAHPAKIESRFTDPWRAREFLRRALELALAQREGAGAQEDDGGLFAGAPSQSEGASEEQAQSLADEGAGPWRRLKSGWMLGDFEKKPMLLARVDWLRWGALIQAGGSQIERLREGVPMGDFAPWARQALWEMGWAADGKWVKSSGVFCQMDVRALNNPAPAVPDFISGEKEVALWVLASALRLEALERESAVKEAGAKAEGK